MSSANLPIKELGESPLVGEGVTFKSISETVCRVTENKAPRGWWIGFLIAATFTGVMGAAIGYLFWTGVGVWGNNAPVYWAWDITNFVWWIGIGHAGTLISAVLFLFRQKWRTAINRFAEAMTIFAVICALIFPGIHVGRAWYAYYMFPVPNEMSIWPNFKSPLIWDVFAVSTYFTVSLLFWYVGLVPDFATLRDRAKNKYRRIVYGALSLGWRGANRHWQNYERAYLILAAISTPLVLSVHSVVSFDFATSLMPGWHTTIFPPYFVAGAVFSGFGMVMTLMLLTRAVYGMRSLVLMKHLELMNKIMLVTGTLVGYAYGMELFIAWYGANDYEWFVFKNRVAGPYAWAYWTMISCNVISPQLFWSKKLRTSIPVMFVVSIFINIGMWFERFVIIVTSLHRDFLPSSWGYFRPTLIDIFTYAGTLGLFFTAFLLFIRWIPMIAIAEVKGVLPEADPHHEPQGHEGEHGAAHAHATAEAE
ncbi:MAG: Molybdopterin oxidoreductase [Labilithrix sp.]|nr:Molybdopterin oxidoreductase [Labilithrix sp.]